MVLSKIEVSKKVMDLETANKLDEVLRPLGYSVGRIYLEMLPLETEIEKLSKKAFNHDFSEFERNATWEKRTKYQDEFNSILYNGRLQLRIANK